MHLREKHEIPKNIESITKTSGCWKYVHSTKRLLEGDVMFSPAFFILFISIVTQYQNARIQYSEALKFKFTVILFGRNGCTTYVRMDKAIC